MPDALITAEIGNPHHTAYLVESIEAAVERLTGQLGAGPFILIEDVPLEDVRSRGEPAQLDHSSAFGSYGGYPIELLELTRAAPERVAARWSGPLPRIHHVGYPLPPARAEGVRASFDEHGLSAYLSSRLGEPRSTLHDASAIFGHDIEIVEDAPAFREFFAMVLAAAESWDGSEPLRAAPG